MDMSLRGDWYTPGLAEFDKQSQLSKHCVQAISSSGVSLDQVVSCISIGPGSGFVDVPLIKDHLPSLRQYYGVEPRPQAVQELKEWMEKDIGPHVKMDLFEGGVEEWSGPSNEEKVDIVLLMSVLYHITDKQKLFRRCVDWLEPGGVLYIVHGGDGLFHNIAVELGACAEQLYITKHVTEDLKAVGLTQCKEQQVHSVNIDLRNSQQPLINFILQKSASEKETAMVNKLVEKFAPSGIYEEPIVLFTVKVE